MTSAELLQQATINDLYAERCLETYAKTGRYSAYHQAQIHIAEAQRKRELAAKNSD